MDLRSPVDTNRRFQTNVNFQVTSGAARKLQDSRFMHTTGRPHRRRVMGAASRTAWARRCTSASHP